MLTLPHLLAAFPLFPLPASPLFPGSVYLSARPICFVFSLLLPLLVDGAGNLLFSVFLILYHSLAFLLLLEI